MTTDGPRVWNKVSSTWGVEDALAASRLLRGVLLSVWAPCSRVSDAWGGRSGTRGPCPASPGSARWPQDSHGAEAVDAREDDEEAGRAEDCCPVSTQPSGVADPRSLKEDRPEAHVVWSWRWG